MVNNILIKNKKINKIKISDTLFSILRIKIKKKWPKYRKTRVMAYLRIPYYSPKFSYSSLTSLNKHKSYRFYFKKMNINKIPPLLNSVLVYRIRRDLALFDIFYFREFFKTWEVFGDSKNKDLMYNWFNDLVTTKHIKKKKTINNKLIFFKKFKSSLYYLYLLSSTLLFI